MWSATPWICIKFRRSWKLETTTPWRKSSIISNLSGIIASSTTKRDITSNSQIKWKNITKKWSKIIYPPFNTTSKLVSLSIKQKLSQTHHHNNPNDPHSKTLNHSVERSKNLPPKYNLHSNNPNRKNRSQKRNNKFRKFHQAKRTGSTKD